MNTDRLSMRGWIAALLTISAALFLVGASIERGQPGSSAAHGSDVIASPPATGEGEAGEGGEGTAAEGGGGERPTAAEEFRPLGVDLESPVLVGGAVLLSLLLAFAVLRTTSPVVSAVVAAFAIGFAVLDLVELSHQLGEGNTGLAVLSGVIAVLHLAVVGLTVRSISTGRVVGAM